MDVGLLSALVVCLTTVCGGEKRTQGAVHRPHRLSVSLTRKPHHALFTMCTHSLSLSLSLELSLTHTATVHYKVKKNMSKIDAKHKNIQIHVGKTGQRKQPNVSQVSERDLGRGEERGKGLVKECEMQYLCNRPHANIIQA